MNFLDAIERYALQQPLITGGVFGAIAAIIDRKVFGRPALGVLIILVAALAELAIRGNPDTFGDFFAIAIVASAFALPALAAYAVAALVLWIAGRTKA